MDFSTDNYYLMYKKDEIIYLVELASMNIYDIEFHQDKNSHLKK